MNSILQNIFFFFLFFLARDFARDSCDLRDTCDYHMTYKKSRDKIQYLILYN